MDLFTVLRFTVGRLKGGGSFEAALGAKRSPTEEQLCQSDLNSGSIKTAVICFLLRRFLLLFLAAFRLLYMKRGATWHIVDIVFWIRTSFS